MIFNGWVFQLDGLCDDPENENFRKISGWVFHNLPIRVNYYTTPQKSMYQKFMWNINLSFPAGDTTK